MRTATIDTVIEFRRISSLPPYAFAEIERLKLELRRTGDDVVDLGFGNPDIPSPAIAVEKLAEAAAKPRNHRYSASRGIPKLREAICGLYARRFGVELDPEREAIATIGAKEGLAHLLWLLVEPGDVALVPAPSYPIHLFAPVLAGASVAQVVMGPGEDVFANLEGIRPPAAAPAGADRLVPAQPDDGDRRWGVHAAGRRLRARARHRRRARLRLRGHRVRRPPTAVDSRGRGGARGRRRAVHAHEGVLHGRLACGLRARERGDHRGARASQVVPRLRHLPADSDRRHRRDRSGCGISGGGLRTVRSRRDTLCDGLTRVGWDVAKPLGTMLVWAPVPPAYRDLGSHEFALKLLREAKVSVSPGAGFGPSGDGHVRFALVENEQRIAQAVRGVRSALPLLEVGGGVTAAPDR